MSNVPYYVPRANQHPPFGTIKMEDGLIKDGLWDVYNQIHMGVRAKETAKKYKISRSQQDDYAIASFHGRRKHGGKGNSQRKSHPSLSRVRRARLSCGKTKATRT